MSYIPRLRKKYKDEIVSKLQEQFEYKSVMQVPKLEKICINQGVGKATQDKKLVKNALEQLTAIAGQKAVATISKKSVSNFKLRDNMPIGAKVTLRNDKMYEFLDREQIIFPEIDIDKIPGITGMDITIVTSAKTDAEALALLKEMGLPFKNQRN